MNIHVLVREVARREGKTQQVNIAQIEEIVGAISDIAYENWTVAPALYFNGKRRAKAKKAKA